MTRIATGAGARPARVSRFVLAGAALTALAFGLGAPAATSPALAQSTTFTQDAKKAALDYADAKAKEVVKEQSKQAIVALYKKLYKSGADKGLVRALGTTALSAEDINAFAQNAADAATSNDPDKARKAREDVAVAFGQTLAKAIRDPALKGQMTQLLGSADKVREISEALGKAGGGDPRSLYEMAGRAVISLTPAAAAFNGFEAATGVMKYAHGKFVDAQIEDLYQKYRDGDAHAREEVREQLETGRIYSAIVNERKQELAAARADAIAQATAEPGDRVREHLTAASEGEIVDDILRSFDARDRKTKEERQAEAAKATAQAQAEAMLGALDAAARQKFGPDWAKARSYNLDLFMQRAQQGLRADGVLDPNDPSHARTMASLLATRLVFGENSPEYREKLAQFEELRAVIGGGAAKPGAAGQAQTGDPTSFDGAYNGAIAGKASGQFRMTVRGSAVSGSITGAYQGDGYNASFSGSLRADGSFSAGLAGVLRGDVRGKVTSYPFNGTVSGRVDGAAGSGRWSGKNQYGSASGSWSARK
jgi:hypothetical protein